MPGLKLYPPVPIPSQEFELDIKKSVNAAVKYVKNYVETVKEDNFQGFLKVDPTIPKVLYFTDSEKLRVPLLLKALSVSFNKKLRFGFVQKTQRDIVDFFHIRKYPTLLVYQEGRKKPSVYDGEFNFKALFEYLNVFSQ